MKSRRVFNSFLATAMLIALVCCRLDIKSPPELAKIVKEKHPDGIPYSVANYGDVPFGKSLGGNIYLPPSVLENCVYEPLDDNAQRQINKVVLATRGDCTFTTKSLNAQKQGAKMAIIADNVDIENVGKIILADDGRGPQVHIPTIFIEKQLGELIHSYILEKKKGVTLMVNFETHQTSKASIDLWVDSNDRSSYILVRKLQPFLDRIQKYINLSVRHPTTSCRSCPETDCYGQNNNYCVNTGFYGYMIEGLGRTIMQEQIREELILKEYGLDKWWKYMQKYDEECDDRFSLQDCAQKIMNIIDPSMIKIEKQIAEQLTLIETIDPNTNETKTYYQSQLLENNRQLKYQSGIIVFPGIIINNITYRGNLQALDVFEMVCASLKDQPDECSLNVIEPETTWRYVVYVCIAIVVFLVLLVGVYRRKVRRELSSNMNKEVNDLVNQYITMYQTQRFEDQGKVEAPMQA